MADTLTADTPMYRPYLTRFRLFGSDPETNIRCSTEKISIRIKVRVPRFIHTASTAVVATPYIVEESGHQLVGEDVFVQMTAGRSWEVKNRADALVFYGMFEVQDVTLISIKRISLKQTRRHGNTSLTIPGLSAQNAVAGSDTSSSPNVPVADSDLVR